MAKITVVVDDDLHRRFSKCLPWGMQTQVLRAAARSIVKLMETGKKGRIYNYVAEISPLILDVATDQEMVDGFITHEPDNDSEVLLP